MSTVRAGAVEEHRAETGETATKHTCRLGSSLPRSLPKSCSTGPATELTWAGPAQEHLQILLSQA